jgi:carboxymethylenebutenolidase
MGGGLAVQLAIHEVAACVVNYGPLPTNIGDIQKIDVPVLGIFGALDRGIPADKVRAFEECMKVAGKRVDIEIYRAPVTRSKIPPTGVIDPRLPPTRGLARSNSSSKRSK